MGGDRKGRPCSAGSVSEAKRRLRPVSSPCVRLMSGLRVSAAMCGDRTPPTINRQKGRSHVTPLDFLFRLIWTDGAG